MSFPFGWMNAVGKRTSGPFAKAKAPPVDPEGRRLLGFTRETHQPLWAPQGHSLTLAANGSGKTTKGLMPWIFSLLASSARPCILILDSKDGEIAAQCAPMLKELGVPMAIIDDTYVLPEDCHGRIHFNAMQSVVQTYRHQPLDLVFATDAVTQTAIEEPEKDERKLGRFETRTIEDNSITKQWFGFSNFEEAERVSKAMGDQHAVATTIGGSSDDLKLQTSLSLIKQRWMSAADLMAMRPDEMLLHIKGLGFYVARTVSQQNIAPYCHLIAPNPLEGGKLTPDPKISFALPEEARS